MKKILFCAVCCVFLITGCGKEDYQFSELKFKEVYGGVDVVGKVKNNSGKDCSLLSVDYEYSSGSLTEEGSFLIQDVPNGETIDISETNYDLDVEEMDDYTISVKEASCFSE